MKRNRDDLAAKLAKTLAEAAALEEELSKVTGLTEALVRGESSVNVSLAMFAPRASSGEVTGAQVRAESGASSGGDAAGAAAGVKRPSASSGINEFAADDGDDGNDSNGDESMDEFRDRLASTPRAGPTDGGIKCRRRRRTAPSTSDNDDDDDDTRVGDGQKENRAPAVAPNNTQAVTPRVGLRQSAATLPTPPATDKRTAKRIKLFQRKSDTTRAPTEVSAKQATRLAHAAAEQLDAQSMSVDRVGSGRICPVGSSGELMLTGRPLDPACLWTSVRRC